MKIENLKDLEDINFFLKLATYLAIPGVGLIGLNSLLTGFINNIEPNIVIGGGLLISSCLFFKWGRELLKDVSNLK